MRKHKASYIYRIGDEIFVIYRLSHYSREPLKAVATGMAYDGHGNHSSDFLRKMKKYSIDTEDNRYEFLTDNKLDMCLRLYLKQSAGAESNRLPEEQVPKRVLDFGETLLNHKFRKMEDRGERIITQVIKLLGDKVKDPKKAKEFLMKNHKIIIGMD